MNYEVHNKHPQGRPRRFDHAEAVRMVAEGKSLAEVGTHFGVHKEAVRQAVRKFEKSFGQRLPRAVSYPVPSVPAAEAKALLAANWTIAEIAKDYGVHPASIHRALKRQQETAMAAAA